MGRTVRGGDKQPTKEPGGRRGGRLIKPVPPFRIAVESVQIQGFTTRSVVFYYRNAPDQSRDPIVIIRRKCVGFGEWTKPVLQLFRLQVAAERALVIAEMLKAAVEIISDMEKGVDVSPNYRKEWQ